MEFFETVFPAHIPFIWEGGRGENVSVAKLPVKVKGEKEGERGMPSVSN